MKRKLWGIACLLVLTTVTGAHAAEWAKYTSADGSFSFHYPAGWTAAGELPLIEAKSPQADEQVLVMALPTEGATTARELAESTLATLRQSMSDLEATGWAAPGEGDAAATCEVSYSDETGRQRGKVLVMLDGAQGIWVSYSASATEYVGPRALAIVQGVALSLAEGNGSAPPQRALPPAWSAEVDAKARAFVFVLEFALAAPLTLAQEEVILGQIRDSWHGQSAAWDQYPAVAQTILNLQGDQVDSLQHDLQVVVQGWLAETDQADPTAAVVRAALAEKGAVAAAGDPSLTEMAATAFAEMLAYSALLQDDPGASLDALSPAQVAVVREQLVQGWSALPAQQRQDVAGSPGLWVCLRNVLRHGSEQEQASIRDSVRQLAASTSAGGGTAGQPAGPQAHPGAGSQPIVMVSHSVLMTVNQMTFNQWMWSRGFKQTPFGW